LVDTVRRVRSKDKTESSTLSSPPYAEPNFEQIPPVDGEIFPEKICQGDNLQKEKASVTGAYKTDQVDDGFE
jgi:hypothetical protein